MNSTARPEPASQLWGIYHTDREYARAVGDPLRTVVEATTKAAAEQVAATLGFEAPWAHPVSPEQARSIHFQSARQPSQPGEVSQPSARQRQHPPTTAQLLTAIEVLNKLSERLTEHCVHAVLQLPESCQAGHYIAQVKALSTEQTTRIENVTAQLKSWREELLQQQKHSIANHV